MLKLKLVVFADNKLHLSACHNDNLAVSNQNCMATMADTLYIAALHAIKSVDVDVDRLTCRA